MGNATLVPKPHISSGLVKGIIVSDLPGEQRQGGQGGKRKPFWLILSQNTQQRIATADDSCDCCSKVALMNGLLIQSLVTTVTGTAHVKG